VTLKVKAVVVVPDPGETDGPVRLPLSGQVTARTEAGNQVMEAASIVASAIALATEVLIRRLCSNANLNSLVKPNIRTARGLAHWPRRRGGAVLWSSPPHVAFTGTLGSRELQPRLAFRTMTSQPVPTSPEIQLLDLEKRFREVRAVDGVSLEIRAGEFFSLLGPSGCGKTTTLRMIGGFEFPTAGRILLRGRDITDDPPDKRPVNMVFQNHARFPHLDVGDNVAFGLKRRHVAKPDIVRRVGEALELVHLTGYERRRPNQLSGGQQQRVALARALVNRPTVLLLDEPLGALDLKLRRRLQLELKRIQVEVGITFVYVTHDQEEALTMSDRIAVMHAGKVEQLGTPEELYERPTSRFVADFIGSTNLLRGRIEDDGWVRLSSGDVAHVAHDGLPTGTEVEISVRPESIALVPPDAAGAIHATVEQAAYLGTTISYQLRTDGGLALTVLSPKTGIRLPVGSDVAVSWSPSEALVLGRGPGEAQNDPEEEPR
jgi:spermidine/putrescine transport system ATP-binding protein